MSLSNQKPILIVLIVYSFSCFVSASVSVSRYHLLDKSNLTSDFLSECLINSLNIPINTQRANFDYKRYCLSLCNQYVTCLVVNYDSVNLICSLYNTGPSQNDLNSLASNVDSLNIYYKQRSASSCTYLQYYDGYSCGKL